ncbi:ferredoxin [Methanohalophilus levihalophilus]|uniref:4Fe-4S binding protein n=1 Tax=Methanohalophilus levihalophilus TaxID=1431282 RepID=UPI001AE27FD4|nr:4Fe-4S binding protein [Methanohalophilus levihalophilus]MBP2029268.1 ferredoxin [Methanohalophilus levihalophilus]
MTDEQYLGIIGCRGCFKCLETCPEGAIKNKGSYVTIDRDKCTMCMKCVESCPYGSIVCLD